MDTHRFDFSDAELDHLLAEQPHDSPTALTAQLGLLPPGPAFGQVVERLMAQHLMEVLVLSEPPSADPPIARRIQESLDAVATLADAVDMSVRATMCRALVTQQLLRSSEARFARAMLEAWLDDLTERPDQGADRVARAS